MEKTLAIIKPDAVKAGSAQAIIDRILSEGFTIVDQKQLHVTKQQAELFYAVHRGKPFYDGLTSFLASGPIIVMVLEKEGAINAWRSLMGATDPLKAAEGTIRKLYGKNIDNNATHGSDAPETAQEEIAFFFPSHS